MFPLALADRGLDGLREARPPDRVELVLDLPQLIAQRVDRRRRRLPARGYEAVPREHARRFGARVSFPVHPATFRILVTEQPVPGLREHALERDRKSTRLNSSHLG